MTITDKQRLQDLIRRAELRRERDDEKIRVVINAEQKAQELKRVVKNG